MMQLIRERLEVKVSQKEINLWDELKADYKPLVHDSRFDMWKKLQVPFIDTDTPVKGEIFLTDSEVILYYLIPSEKTHVEAGCLISSGDGLNIFQGFCERLKDALLPGYKDREPFWKPLGLPSPSFQLLQEEAKIFSPAPEEIAGARALQDPKIRAFLNNVHARGSSFLEDLAGGKEIVSVGEELSTLDELKLIQKEFVVFCRQTKNQISKVNTYSAIEDAAARGFKCFSCGRPISEERIDQLISCTPTGEKLSRPNYWLALLVTQILNSLDISTQQILSAISKDFRIIDLFINQDDHLVMFEMKDEAPSLEEVHGFLARISFYKPDAAFFVTIHPVSQIVRQYLAAPRQTQVVLLESLVGLEDQIRTVIFKARRDSIHTFLSTYWPFTKVPVADLVVKHFTGTEEEEEILEEAVPPIGVMHADMEEYDLREESEMASPEDFIIPGEVEMEPLSAFEEPHSRRAAPPLVALEPAPPVEPLPAAPSGAVEATEPAAAEPREAPVDVQAEDLPQMEEAVDDFGTGLPVEFLSPEEPLPMILQVEENEEQIIRKAVEEIGASGVIGRIESIEHQLREISSGGSLTAALVDGTGLSIANFLESVKDADLAAALGVEIFDGIGRTFTEAGMAPLSSCVIASTKGKFHVHAVERGLYLVVNQEEKGREFEDETYSGQSETVLRDAILNKVLEDLGALEGIKGNLVVGRDGLLIEAMLKDDQNADLLGAICSQVVIDNERFFQKLDLVPVKQVFIRTGGLYYSLIPLDKEGILMSLLEPEVSREIWNSRLPTSATMLASVFQ